MARRMTDRERLFRNFERETRRTAQLSEEAYKREDGVGAVDGVSPRRYFEAYDDNDARQREMEAAGRESRRRAIETATGQMRDSQRRQRRNMIVYSPNGADTPSTKGVDSAEWIRRKNLTDDVRRRGSGAPSVTVGGKTFTRDPVTGRMDFAGPLKAAGDIASRNESRRQMLDVMQRSGLYDPRMFSGPGVKNSWFDKDGVATEITPQNRQRLYDIAYKKLQSQFQDSRTKSDEYGQVLDKAREGFKGPRSWQDVRSKMDSDPKSDIGGPWGQAAQRSYDERTTNLVQIALMRGNKSEAERLLRQARSREVMREEMRDKAAQRAFSGTAQSDLVRAQRGYEEQLLAERTRLLNRMSSAMKMNAQLASMFGVDAKDLRAAIEKPAARQFAAAAAQQPAAAAAQQPVAQQPVSSSDVGVVVNNSPVPVTMTGVQNNFEGWLLQQPTAAAAQQPAAQQSFWGRVGDVVMRHPVVQSGVQTAQHLYDVATFGGLSDELKQGFSEQFSPWGVHR